jgi:hypothetical protein
MADRDYVKLDPARMGFTHRGRLGDEDAATLREALARLREATSKTWDRSIAKKEIFWLNVWQEDDPDEVIDLADAALAEKLHALARRLATEHAEPGALVDGYGFIVNPVGSKGQVWHVDYTTDAAVIWVPVTAYTAHNATQYVTLPADTPDDVLHDIASYVDEVDLDDVSARVPWLGVHQMIAAPMSIVPMGRGTIHRGVPNKGKEHRIGFYVSVHYIEDYAANYPYPRDAGTEATVVVFGDKTRAAE